MKNSSDFKIFDWQKVRKFLSNPRQVRSAIATAFPYVLIYVVFILIANSIGFTKESVQAYFDDKSYLFVSSAFVGMQLLASLTPLPDLPFLAAGVLFFSPPVAFSMILLGMWLGTMINFVIARRLGRSYMQKKYPQTSEWIDKFTGKYGVQAIIIARSFTFVTFDLVAYTAGVSNIPIIKFLISSLLGLIPVALNATLMGIALTSTLEKGGLSTINISRSIAFFLFSISFTFLFAWLAQKYSNWLDKREKKSKV